MNLSFYGAALNCYVLYVLALALMRYSGGKFSMLCRLWASSAVFKPVLKSAR